MSDPTAAVLGKSADEALANVIEELTRLIENGEVVDLETYTKQYPEHAAQLRHLIPALKVLRDLDVSAVPAPVAVGSAVPADDAPAGRLGDYRIIREIGRGGMGVVYEAEQLSLGRRVALKVLPFAAVMDGRQLARFKNESTAAAQLHHNNIVPVYSVGSERGVHYYAMQYVEGQTLVDVIRDLRQASGLDEQEHVGNGFDLAGQVASGQFAAGAKVSALAPTIDSGSAAPSPANASAVRGTVETAPIAALSTEKSTKSAEYFRTIANLGIQAAEALDHAHSNGVLHRDIKPGNLILDTRGNLWVTDFGLARLEANPGMTMTGDLIGTMRYMSPEQALAKRVVVDHRTDIYSLGVTLYELLTLHPAYPGRDREELLKQIAFTEPKAPRRINPAIPAELETITLKAMAKNPEERYATAQELADDLRRWQLHEPIKAKRPSLVNRTKKWSRRHNRVLTATAATALVAFALGTLLLWHGYRREGNLRALAQQRTNDANRQRARALEHFRRARDTINEYLAKVDKNTLLQQPDMHPLRDALLEPARKYYAKFIAEAGADPELQADLATAYERVGQIALKLGHDDDGRDSYQKALQIRKQLAEVEPDNPELQHELAETYARLGQAQKTFDENIAFLEQAANSALPLVKPAHRSALGMTYLKLAFHCMGAYGNSGDIKYRDKAFAAVEKARSIFRALLAEYPAAPKYQQGLGQVFQLMASLHGGIGNGTEEESFRRKSKEIRKQLADQYPGNDEYQYDFGNACFNLGEFQEAMEVYKKLATEHPKDDVYQDALRHVYQRIASQKETAGNLAEALTYHQSAVDVARKTAEKYPSNRSHQARLASALDGIGKAQKVAGKLDEAIGSHQTAIAILQEHAPYAKGSIADAYENLSSAQQAAGRLDEAIASMQAAAESGRQLVDAEPKQLRYRAATSSKYVELAALQRKARRFEEALESCRKAKDLLERAFVDGKLPDAPSDHLAMANLVLEQSHTEMANCLKALDRDEADRRRSKQPTASDYNR